MSDQNGAGLSWRKASASNTNGNCVEVAAMSGGGVAVRDSKDPGGPILRFTAAEWAAFAEGMAAGEFDMAHQA
ncbi:MAG TPA: DUF397 domain-containing protein [Actinocrinis sp.]|uniref:DUF397 domain-containing protein n=1 Tax=Actinocrinis sp. TaxID=1920516 RepID=UPI002DDCB593|nr:DUF397 domain-containing protein [Actinocrinis sp.]HEV2347334.1 DUF397 domain-containing protein [Actinocrinis sp.]